MFKLLDEKGFRKEPFDDRYPIRLMDGQDWYFPMPIVCGTYPSHVGGEFVMRLAFDYGEEYGTLFDTYVEDPNVLNLVKLAWCLLAKNYTLEPNAIGGLFYRPVDGDPRRAEAEAVYQAVWEHVMGRGPKPTPVGSDSASSPTG